jgi:hypothetical protein
MKHYFTAKSIVGVVILGLTLGFVLSAQVASAADLYSDEYDFGYDSGGYDFGYDSGYYDYGYDSEDYDHGYDYSSYDYDFGYDSGSYDYGYDSDYSDFGYDSNYYDYGYDSNYYDYGYDSDDGYDSGTLGYDSDYYDYGYDSGYDDYGYDSGSYDYGYDSGYYGYDSDYDDYGYDSGYDDYGYDPYDDDCYYDDCYDDYEDDYYEDDYDYYGGSTYSAPKSYSSGLSYYVKDFVSSYSPKTKVVTVGGGSNQNVNKNYNYNYNYNTGSHYTPPVQHPQPTCTIWASNSSVQSGGSTTLNWSTSNASSASLTDFGSVSTGSNRSQVVHNLYSTRTYSMTVYGQGGSATCQTTVGVYSHPTPAPTPSAPTCAIYVTPTQKTAGQSATLSWTTSGNASSAIISNIGSVNLSGSRSVNPSQTTHYTMTVYGQGGSTTCNTVLNVSSNPNVLVNLAQVPYTGFDLGPWGNAAYFLALSGMSVGAAYMLFFFRGGIHNGYAFAAARRNEGEQEATIINEYVLPGYGATDTSESDVAAAIAEPIAREKVNTRDTMAMVTDGKSQPRLVINRAQANVRTLPGQN